MLFDSVLMSVCVLFLIVLSLLVSVVVLGVVDSFVLSLSGWMLFSMLVVCLSCVWCLLLVWLLLVVCVCCSV